MKDHSSNPTPTMTADKHYMTNPTWTNETDHMDHIPYNSYNNGTSNYPHDCIHQLHMT